MSGEGKVVCVTGASGYVASWLVKLLLQSGYTVKASVRDLNDPKKTEHLVSLEGAKERLHLYKANLLEEGSFDSVVDGCECVFHTASPLNLSPTNPQVELIDPALKGTLNVLRSCTKVPSLKRVVLTSSITTVLLNGKPLKPDVVVDETWFSDPSFCEESKFWYVLSKVFAEEAAWKFAKDNGIDLVAINPGSVIGPSLQPTLNLTVEGILNLVNGTSQQQRKGAQAFPNSIYRFVDVRDVAKAHVQAFEVASASGRYCFVGHVVHISEALNILRRLYPTLSIPQKCEDDKPAIPTYKISKEKAESLGINFTPLENLLRRLDSKRAPSSLQEAAAQALLSRLLPTLVSSFVFKIVPKDVCHGHSCFMLTNCNLSSKQGPEIMIKGTTGVELASGLHWYLKYWCGAHISWDKTGGAQIASIPNPGSLPPVKNEGFMIKRPVPWNYYQNVVTSSYSFVWWDWERWEKEIDWMALQGINLPLAFTGQEAIWQKVFMDFNISKKDLNDFFGGPAFLAWARMGNLHAWGGPLSQNWLDKQLVLQKQILARMLELGMTPVLPSFSGNVPASLKKIRPLANITRLGDWNTVNGDPRWCCTYLLDPSDPLFVELGAAFIKLQIKEYGDVTDIYSCDTFNENSPPTSDPAYISSLGAAVYEAMSEGDKDAVWLMQGWLFYSDSLFWKPPQMKALLHSVPFGKMIVLDLFADVKPIWKTSSQFYGTPYVWCLLHNFGGNIEMYGILDAVSSGPVDARISRNSTMVGVGMCMEGIEHNPVVYELMSEMAFRSEKVKLQEWLKLYSRRRYGKAVHEVEAAWEILHQTIYNCTDGIADHNTDFIVKLPDWNPEPNHKHNSPKQNQMQMVLGLDVKRRFLLQESSNELPWAHLWYSTQEVINALKLFIDAGSNFAGSLTFRYDLVDLTRQALSKLANQAYLDAVIAFREKDVNACRYHSQKFVQLIKDIDVLLASDDNFLLGTWLESAKKLAVDPRERRQCEWNARTQVTMWYDNTKTDQSKLHDYANKFWSGLLESYYLPRASSYFNYLLKSLTENESFKLEDWRREWILFSNNWQEGTGVYPVKAKGDALAISKLLYQKYFS